MKKLKKSLWYSFWDGIYAAIQMGFVEQFVTPLALFLGAGNVAIGFLNFVRNSFVSIVQVFSADLTKLVRSRKKLVTTAVFLTALLWLPTYLLPFYCGQYKVLVFIILFTITSAFNSLATPAWASMMSQHIPPRKRGAYFGWRGMVLGLVYCAALLMGGVLLSYLQNISLSLAFGVLMALASLTRFLSWYNLTKMFEPPARQQPTHYFSLWQFMKQARQSNFARFTFLCAAFMLGVAMVAPFFAVYILNDLHFSYFQYTLLVLAASLTTYGTQQYWGVLADKYGNIKIIRLTSLLISLIPLLWIFSTDLYYLIMVQLLAGLMWAGFNLTTGNFIYDVAVAGKRERCLSYYNFFSGIGLGVGALIGGYFYRYLPPWLGFSFYLSLILSGFIRVGAAVLLNLFVKEVRSV
jgi:MFS family permease